MITSPQLPGLASETTPLPLSQWERGRGAPACTAASCLRYRFGRQAAGRGVMR